MSQNHPKVLTSFQFFTIQCPELNNTIVIYSINNIIGIFYYYV